MESEGNSGQYRILLSPKLTNYETQDEHGHFQKDFRKGFFPQTLLRKLLKDVFQENKEGKQKREGNEIQKTSNPGKGRTAITEGKLRMRSGQVLDSDSSRKGGSCGGLQGILIGREDCNLQLQSRKQD